MKHLTPPKIVSALLFVFVLSGCDSDSTKPTGPAAAELSLRLDDIKTFHFSWPAVAGATHYQLREDPDGKAGTQGWTMLVELPADTHEYRLKVPLYARAHAQYLLSSCNANGCTVGQAVMIDGNPELNHLVKSIGYLKASNTGKSDQFGTSVSLNQDGTVLAVGAPYEDGDDETKSNSGAVYLFSQDAQGNWQGPKLIKADDAAKDDKFGISVSLNDTGDVLAVGAYGKNSNNGAVYLFSPNSEGVWEEQTVVTGDGNDYLSFGYSVSLNNDGTVLAVGAYGVGVSGSATELGYAFIFVPDDETPLLTDWTQQARLFASNAEPSDLFGGSVSLDDAGTLVAVGAWGIGLVYLFGADDKGAWTQQALIKASNSLWGEEFGISVSLNGDGTVLAVGADGESNSVPGVHHLAPTTDDGQVLFSGAVYTFSKDGNNSWEPQAYIKANHPHTNNYFGYSVSLSADGQRLVVGAIGEKSNATGLSGNGEDDTAYVSGAAYSYVVQPDGSWQFESYLKASNTGKFDLFGKALSLSGDGQTLAVGAKDEGSKGQGVGGLDGDDLPEGFDPLADDTMPNSGAVYLY